jgi:hypothetical protein
VSTSTHIVFLEDSKPLLEPSPSQSSSQSPLPLFSQPISSGYIRRATITNKNYNLTEMFIAKFNKAGNESIDGIKTTIPNS